ncbi:MAG: GAF domain-containing protein, partial [Deltaproteobacteria bacterium]|nr:GAF domain-containing protein [Deltaproteobacteria bacterium]
MPSLYGAALLAGYFTPGRAAPYLAVGAIVAVFLAHFTWRIHSLVTRTRTLDVDRVEVGLLAMLALSTALEMLGVPGFYRPPAYGVLIVALAGGVTLPGILALPIAAVLGGPTDGSWLAELTGRLPVLVPLELLALTAGVVVALEKRRVHQLEVSLEKFHLDRDHMARAEGAPADGRHDLARLDDTLYGHLQQIKETAEAHAAVLALKGPKGDLFIRELVSDSHSIREEGVLALDGTTFQWIMKNRKPLRSGRISDPARLGYYRGKVAVKSFLGVPLLEGEEVEGVLALDSLREDAFGEGHLGTLKVASHHVMTVLKQERALGQSQREVRIFKTLHDFSKRIGNCGSSADLLDLVLQVVDERVQPEFSAVVLASGEGNLSVEAVGGEPWAELRGRTFDPGEGLAGWVLSSRQYLYYDGLKERSRRPVFAREVKVPDFPSLLINPLEAGGESLGVLCLGSPTPKAFDSSIVALCEILAQQAAQTLLQIRHVEQLNRLATTDGLTGLLNRRVFFERLHEEVRRSRRYPNTVSLLMIDADHFKRINDRLGHPAGDEVLRRIAGALGSFARET